MSDNTIQLEGAVLFVHLIQRFKNQPHEALQTMIERDQDIEEVRKYLLAMVDEIEEVQNAN
jgi:hypothetical protein